jgi:AbrB family looped-hinge helix DNA binding protein
METLIVGEGGQITIPKSLREKYGIGPKRPVIIEDRKGEIIIRPAIAIPLDKLKTFVREYDDEFVQKLIEDNIVSPEEEKRIYAQWLDKND